MERISGFMNRWLGKLYVPCRIPADKQAHALSGLLLFGVLWVGFGPQWAIHLLIAAAFGKEIYDYFHPDIHSCDVMDIVATTLLPVFILSAMAVA